MSTQAEDALTAKIALHYKLVTQAQIDNVLKWRVPGDSLSDSLLSQGVIRQDQYTWLRNALVQMAAKAGVTLSSGTAAPAPAAKPVAKEGAAVAAVPATSTGASTPNPSGIVIPKMETILARAMEMLASDVHVHSGGPVQMRVNGTLKELKLGNLRPEDAERLLLSVLDDNQRKTLFETQDLDFALQLPGVGRFRCNFYRQQRGWDGVFRPISENPPTLDSLGLPSSVTKLLDYHQGLILLTGPAGCGKSSTMAALVNLVNETREDHIITVEDPVEYVHKPKKCIVNQRQAGKHTLSFGNALRGALREDPDVIVIGELRDLETIQLAITAAETGHLVMGTLHTNSALRTINRILDVFPPKQQSQIRAMVSESLRAIVSQRLVPSADGTKRVAAAEILFVKPSVSNLIRDEKVFQIKSIMQTARSDGMWLLDDSLLELVKSGQITKDTAQKYADDPKRFK